MYGCNLDEQNGAALLDKLAIITGADIAASNDATGSAKFGGDWELEVTRGNIETAVAVDQQLANLYSHILDITSATVTFTNSSGNFVNTGSLTSSSGDVLYKVNGDSNYQLKIDGADRGTYQYTNPGTYVLLDATADGNDESMVTFSFVDGNLFTANSITVANYEQLLPVKPWFSKDMMPATIRLAVRSS